MTKEERIETLQETLKIFNRAVLIIENEGQLKTFSVNDLVSQVGLLELAAYDLKTRVSAANAAKPKKGKK